MVYAGYAVPEVYDQYAQEDDDEKDEVNEKKSSSGPEELKPTQIQKSLPRSFLDPLLNEFQDS